MDTRYDEYTFYIPCANDGHGETVTLTGYLRHVFHVTENSNGFTVKINDHPYSLKGYGDISGDAYVATGAFNQTLSVKAGITNTIVSTYRVLGQGADNNIIGTFIYHLTINGNGEVVVSAPDSTFKCL